ncbi:protein LZIC-like [Paramacrobiotus metropolitanus]|uniref:protein LZIC-like n=1 Tax=Paramacrobiotus metropolitanus TaxID=2943436 RepID=UPI00244567B8|nr:protein LZIC-like [Paramacrobiotus metropolitanus]
MASQVGNSASRGKVDKETESLKKNLTEQLDRLMAQLVDLETEKAKGGIDADDFEEQRADTVEQLQELNDSLAKMQSGNLTLLNDIASMQLTIQTAIGNAFDTPEIMALFVAREPDQLRERLAMVERDRKVNKMSVETYNQQKGEILTALVKLRAALTPEEEAFLRTVNSLQSKGFVQAGDANSLESNKVMRMVSGK